MPLKEYGNEEQKEKLLESKIAVDKEWFDFLDKFFVDMCVELSDYFIPIAFLYSLQSDNDIQLNNTIETIVQKWADQFESSDDEVEE